MFLIIPSSWQTLMNVFFYIDDEPEKLYLSISGYGEWDEEEFTTSGAMEIFIEED